MLWTGLLVAAAGIPVIVLVTALVRPSGVLSAAVGALVAIAFFVLGHVGVTAVVSGAPPALSLPGAFVVYLGQLIALVAALLVLRRLGWVDGPPFAMAAIVTTVLWQVGAVIGFRRSRHVVYADVTLPGEGETR